MESLGDFFKRCASDCFVDTVVHQIQRFTALETGMH
jgi:hypothetical protein